MKRIKKKHIMKYIFLAIFAFFMVWQFVLVRMDFRKYPAVGTLLDVNSYSSHTYVNGEGDNTVVFITGSGTPCAYTDFYNLQNEFSKYAKTITYDHAGYGWSEETKIPRTVDNLALELNRIGVQRQLAKWSTNSKQVTLKNSDHYIHWSNRDEVIEYIYEFIESIKK